MKTGRILLSLVVAGMLGACSSSEDDSGGRGSGSGSGSGSGAGTNGGFDNGGGSNLGGAGNGSGTDGPMFYGDTCAPKDASMWFVVDGSGSMTDAFGTSDRWTTLRSALMDADGAVARLQDVVDFGLIVYDGPIDIGAFLGVPTPGLCPQLVQVPVAAMNYDPINAAYPQQPLGGSTPTHQGMEAARLAIQAALANPDAEGNHYIILATDGAPNSLCDGAADPPGQVIQQTTMALNEGVKTFVISLAGGDANLTAHLTQVAEAGGTGSAPFIPDDKDALVSTLREIVTGATGCDLLAPE